MSRVLAVTAELAENDVNVEPLSDSLGSQESTRSIPRRHDLDALRAIAMLLGIALHAAISFMPSAAAGWSVVDTRQSVGFEIFMGVIHGFRMPLFFLISGFFTAMLWRKRGLNSLIGQRIKRILLPLMVGMVTIVPAVWVVSIAASIYQSKYPAVSSPKDELFTAATEGDVDRIASLVSEGVDPNTRDDVFGVTPLTASVRFAKSESVDALITGGADVNARNRDGSTSLHAAAFLGRDKAFQQLIGQGATPGHRDRAGTTPVSELAKSWGETVIVASVLKVPAQQDNVFAGRKAIARATAGRDPASQQRTGDQHSPAGELARIDRSERFAGLSLAMMLLAIIPIFHHLWFLWFLCWLVAAFAIYAHAIEKAPWRIPSRAVISPLRYIWLIPLTFISQSQMGMFGFSFGPDTSTGFLPSPHILAYYAIFFFFGAVYFDSDDEQGRLGRRWYLTLPIALLVVFPIAFEMSTGTWGFMDQWLDSAYFHPAAVLLQVLYVWMLSFGLMGLFRRFCANENASLRYISDSSYWLYLAHLPLIIAAQAIVRSWDLPAIVKFTLVCIVTTSFLLATYQWCVRYTIVGSMLNGPRKRPEKIAVAELVVDPG